MYTVKQLAEIMCVSIRTVYRMLDNGTIPCAIKLGQWRFPKHETDRWLSQMAGKYRDATGRKKYGTKD